MRLSRAVAAVLSLPALLGIATAAEVNLSLDAASAYVWRGATWNDSPVLQPGLEIPALKLGETELPLSIGVWGNFDLERVTGPTTDEEGNVTGTETVTEAGGFSEVDFWICLDLPTGIEALEASVGYVEYLYPQAGGDSDRQVMATLSVDTLLEPTATIYYGIDGEINKLAFLEFGIGHSLDLTEDLALEVGALVGYAIPDEGKDGWNNLDLSTALSWKALTATLTYVVQLDDEVLTDDLFDVEVVGMLGLSHTF